jgi:hypothetical protein
MHIYVEEIENMPTSIEIVALNEEVIFEFLKILEVTKILKESVPQYLKSISVSTNKI